MRVAVAQFASGSDKDANRRVAVDSLRAAAGGGAGMVVLPEASMHAFGAAGIDLTAVAESLDGPFVSALASASAETGVVAVAGLFEVAGSPGRVFNTVVVVDGSGVLARYRKVHLYDALGWRESDRVAPGDPASPPAVVEVGDLRIGVMTCFDLRFPEVARVLVDHGATVLAVPAAWVAGPGKQEQWEVLLRARAIESTAFVVAAGQPGPVYTGCSTIVGPTGVVVAALSGSPDGGPGGLAFADAAASEVADVRAAMPVLASRRFTVAPA